MMRPDAKVEKVYIYPKPVGAHTRHKPYIEETNRLEHLLGYGISTPESLTKEKENSNLATMLNTSFNNEKALSFDLHYFT